MPGFTSDNFQLNPWIKLEILDFAESGVRLFGSIGGLRREFLLWSRRLLVHNLDHHSSLQSYFYFISNIYIYIYISCTYFHQEISVLGINTSMLGLLIAKIIKITF